MNEIVRKRRLTHYIFAPLTAAVTALCSVPFSGNPVNAEGENNWFGSMSSSDIELAASSSAITLCGGWYETAFAEWDESIGSEVNVSYKEHGTSDYVQADSELIRGNRVDIPGLKGNVSYDLRITGSAAAAECTVTTMENDRSGYAHWNQSEGVGAYNNDGTPKAGATILYVTNDNKDTITYNGKTGLYNIFDGSKGNNLIIRFIGDVEVPAGAKANDGKQNDGSHMLYLKDMKNVTIEGIGYDAHLVRWGFEIRRCTNVEVKNLYFYQYPDDAIGVAGSDSERASHIWIHNNSFGVGLNEYAGNGTVDSDKAEGDGTTDIKWAEYVTVSYNYYNKSHKTSLVGGGPTHMQDWITYHHNWFDETESRNPRARNAHIHMFNNYFRNNSSYAVGASYNSKIFTESNYFEGSKDSLLMQAMGSDKFSGTIKSYNDVFDGCKGDPVYTAVTSRNASADIPNLKSGGDAYDNFDLDSSKIYLDQYTTQTPEKAKQTTIDYSGRMQHKAYSGGTVNPENPDPTEPTEAPTQPPTQPPTESPTTKPSTDPQVTPTEPDPDSNELVLDASNVAVGSYSQDVKVNSRYTIKANAADAVIVAASQQTTSDGKHNISNRIHLGGKGDTANRSIAVNAGSTATLMVYMMSSSATAERTVNLLNADGEVIASVTGVNGTSLDSYTFDIPESGTYYIASAGSGLYVYYAELDEFIVEPPIIPGNACPDNVLNAFDAVAMRDGIVNGFNNSAAKSASDIDHNGTVDSNDLKLLNDYLLGRIDFFQ